MRVASCAASALLLVALLFGWVFPAVSPLLPFTDNTVGAATGAGG